MRPLRVIGEVGASSSRWAVVRHDGAELFPHKGEALPGFNPLNGDPDLFAEGLRSSLLERAPDALEAPEVLVYGAGCGSPERRVRMASTIAGVWPQAAVHVDTDLMGAARGAPTQEGRTLRLPLRPLAPGGYVRIPLPLPGVKPGLANIVTLIVLLLLVRTVKIDQLMKRGGQ